MEIKVDLAGIPLEHPIMNAAGTCKLIDGPEGVKELARSETAAIMVGSITVEPRPGNEGEVYWADKTFSLNSLGLPNPGADYYRQNLPEMVKIAHDAGKPLFVSVAGFEPIEYATLASIVCDGGADLIELNLSCPNVWAGGAQKRIACFDKHLVHNIIDKVKFNIGGRDKKKIAIKVSPFSDPLLLAEIADKIHPWGIINAVTATNTFPNTFSFNEEGNSRITPGGGLAGFGGPALKPIGLGQVKQFRDILPDRIAVIGAGGIASGQDILDYLRVGASAVQIATALLEKGPAIFGTLLSELIELN